MEPRTNLSWRMGQRALSIYLSVACRGLRILAVHAGMVLGPRGACSDFRTRIPLVSVVLRLAFTSSGTRRADFPSGGKRFTRLLCSPSQVLLWPVQVTQHDSAASFNSTVGAPYRTPALRPYFVEIQRIRLYDGLAAEICRLGRRLARSQRKIEIFPSGFTQGGRSCSARRRLRSM